MKLRVERRQSSRKSTIGELFVDGAFECYTIEDVVREIPGEEVADWKVQGMTAIPRGTYNVTITPSPHFKRDLPLLEKVPGFTGVRIHPGNTDADTEGCILVGRTAGTDFVGESKAAFAVLYKKIKEALDSGDVVTIEVV